MLLIVTGIIKDPPLNSSLRFNAVMSVKSLPKIYPQYCENSPFLWSFETFLAIDKVYLTDNLTKQGTDLFMQIIPVESLNDAKLFKTNLKSS
jgi:hypothetical protein